MEVNILNLLKFLKYLKNRYKHSKQPNTLGLSHHDEKPYATPFLICAIEYQDLRENIKYPQVICPSNEKTLPLIIEMLNQVIDAHPNSEMIHIGADEVYILGECQTCYQRMVKNNLTKMQLFINHVTAVAKRTKEFHPNIRILIWDDEFRKANRKELLLSEITKLVEPVSWSYQNDVFIVLK